MQFIKQPFAKLRLGEFLLAHLVDPHWTSFRAAVAFVKRSGTQYVRQPLLKFSNHSQVRITAGVDLYGTSREGLSDLLDSTPNGAIYIYRNSGPYTFHPKIYLFKSTTRAELVVGSGNLTGGGLFTNYEASLVASLNLGEAMDAAFLSAVEETLDTWSQPQAGMCYLLTPEFLEHLVASGLVRSEAQLAAMQQAVAATPPAGLGEGAEAGGASTTASFFATTTVPPPPPIVQAAAQAAAPELVTEAVELPSAAVLPPPGIVPYQGTGPTCFVVTLQNTDVGVGQTTAGTSRRSPEVFIPLAALDQDPDFWTFPTQFTADAAWDAAHPQHRRNGLGKLDRMDVPMRIGVIHPVRMFFNPQKKDFRLRNEALRSSGHIGDLLLVRRVDPSNGFEYDIQVAPQGSLLFDQLVPYCNVSVPNSPKHFGYF